MRKFYSLAISNGIENVRDKMSDQLMAEIPGPQTCSKANSERTDNLRNGRDDISDFVFRTGVLCIILCFALGIANIFHFHWIILFSVICL